MEATAQNLKKVLDDLKSTLNKQEQFLFYASDHGGLVPEPAGLVVWGMLGVIGVTLIWRRRALSR